MPAIRRETLIALRARRASHQVAASVYLHEHVRQLLQKCISCGNEFVPSEAGQEQCPQCAPRTWWRSANATPESPQTPPRGRISSLILRIHEFLMLRPITAADAFGVVLIFALIAGFIALALLTIRMEVVRAVGH